MEEILNDRNFDIMPVLCLRNLVALPGMALTIDVGREKSMAAVDNALKGSRNVFLVTQRFVETDDPSPRELFDVGCIAYVRQVLKTPAKELRVTLDCLTRGVFTSEPFVKDGSYYAAAQRIEETVCLENADVKTAALMRKAREAYDTLMQYMEKSSPEVLLRIQSIDDAGTLADYIAQNVFLKYTDRQKILQTVRPWDRLEELIVLLVREADICAVEEKLAGKVRSRITKNQRDIYLREQLHALQEELGDQQEEFFDDEENEYYTRIRNASMPEECRKKLYKEVSKLSKMPYSSQEGALIQNYLDVCLELPWGVYSKETIDMVRAEKILERDHYGLEKVKERILETLAVKKLNPSHKGQILCLVGPPGTGKTSVAESVASAMRRKFVRVSLGGVHDESEIRGHRRTYLGSMPGKIIAAITEAKVSNPVILLDEIDKLGADYKGDPAAALLEVLDPEQNNSFRDHFIDMPFDLSGVFFITTANTSQTIPAPLYDRMDIIELSSYTQEEKFHIAKRHLIKKQLKKHGLTSRKLKITDDAVEKIITAYTKEAGVRRLEGCIAKICRKAARQFTAENPPSSVTVTLKNLADFLGSEKFKPDHIPEKDSVGTVTGLAYTTAGGEIMPLEVSVMPGTGKIELTGSLGDVMKESAKAAISYIRKNSEKYGIDPKFYKEKDIHVHAPEGAVPKDGPSAGCAMATALLSELTGMKIRRDVAMTGEITIRGNVLPIGGLKEKTMAAYKAGVKTVIIPADNEGDIDELSPVVKDNLEFITVNSIEKVFDIAFVEKPVIKTIYQTVTVQ